jgi:DNA (cytosine-5)-methyltransferase 1
MATLKKSTGEKSKNPTSSVGVTHVSLSVRQVSGEVKKIRGICGHGSEQPLANYDPDTQSWKMYGDISLWGDCPLLVNLPVSGMTQNGVLFLQHPWEPITGETESSLWPTPTVDDASNVNPKPNRFRGLVAAVNETWPTPTAHPDNSNKNGKFKNPTLGDAVRDMETWPTPTASDWKGRGPNSKQQGLSEVVKYPTPLASGGGGTGHWNKIENLYLDGQLTYEEKMAMQAGNGGRLNPTWVEWLMGFPTGWTDLEDSATL